MQFLVVDEWRPETVCDINQKRKHVGCLEGEMSYLLLQCMQTA